MIATWVFQERFLRFRVAHFLLFGVMSSTVFSGCGGQTEPTEAELRSAEEIRNLGGRITMRGKMHVEVILGGTKVQNTDLALLSDLDKLELLNLQDTEITDGGLEIIGRLKTLQRLSLQRSQVTDEGLANLKDLTSLVELDLSGLPITDAGLEHLRSMVSLEKLYFDKARTTAAGRNSLQDALPNTKIFAD